MKAHSGMVLLTGVLGLVFSGTPTAKAQTAETYTVDSEWARLPEGSTWNGSTSWITADGRGNVVVLVRTPPYFRMFTREGEFVKAWGGEVAIESAHSLTIDRDNYYWVTDSASHVVHKFSPDGELIMTLGTQGVVGDNSSRDLFNQPNHVAIAPNGDIYVSDGYANARVIHFSPNGDFIRVIGGEMGNAPGQLQLPHGVAIDSRGRILVNDSDNTRVSIFDKDGKFVESWPYPSRGGIEVTADDTVYISDVNAGIINVVKDGERLATYHADRAHGLGVDTDGSIYASGASRMTVMKITP
jgi:streptogramin lyase